MKKLILIPLLLIPVLVFSYQRVINGGRGIQVGVIKSAPTTVAANNGFVGTKNASYTGFAWIGRQTFSSTFTATTSGDVAYIYYDVGGTSSLNINIVRTAIYDSSGNLLKESVCVPTSISGTLYRFDLTSSLSINSGTIYKLAVVPTDADWYLARCATVGNIFTDDTLNNTINLCPSASQASITDDTRRTNAGTLPIWASNISNDSH